jgi:hypothetical protein
MGEDGVEVYTYQGRAIVKRSKKGDVETRQ